MLLFSGERSFACQTKPLDLGEDIAVTDGAAFKAPMNGTVAALFAEPGQQVDAGTTLAIMEAMKMEHAIKAPCAGTVTDVFYSVGDLVDGGADLLTFEAADPADLKSGDLMLFQRTNGLYASVGGFGPLRNKVFLKNAGWPSLRKSCGVKTAEKTGTPVSNCTRIRPSITALETNSCR